MRRSSHPHLAALCLLGALAAAPRAEAGSGLPITGDPPANLAAVIAQIQSKPFYGHSSWGISVVDRATGEVLLDQGGTRTLVPGSIMKVYSTATALDAYGPDYRFRTPVYRLGTVADGVLQGTLVLVASGDFSFGLRELRDGRLGFNSLPELDHNYADTGFPGGALVKDSNPLAALDKLAAKLHAAGLRQVAGDVVIDDRLFATYRDWPDGLIAPIWVNENVIDITAAPTRAGQPAAVDWRPKTGAFKVVSEVTTVAESGTPLEVDSPQPGIVRIRGQIAAGSKPALAIRQIDDPAAFARVAFIEALQRAGIAVSASAGGPNPVALLPRDDSYPAEAKLAEHVSPPLSEFVKVVLKVSYNRGADLMLCLAAVWAGSRDCAAGIGRELALLARLGIPRDSTVVFDGAGSDDHDHTAPADQTTFLRAAAGEPWGAALRDGLAILGVDGTQAMNGVGTPAAGRLRVKDGSRVSMTPGQLQGILIAKTQVGYVDARSGRQLVFAVFVNNAPFRSFDDFIAADHDVAAIAAAIQEAY
jgi:D-alanyl-D-alanine carboxypeptidase/D-alanyl-D-alanine-endopeptidase (penicillin-binding protein 4)